MTGAVTYAASVRDSYKEHTAIVLITDSLVDADACGSTIASVASVAAAARRAGTPTYVIENVVPLLAQLPVLEEWLALLEPIATAGGTTARSLGLGTDLAALLLEIQRIEAGCQYALPEGYAWEQLQLALPDPSGPRPFPRVESAAQCMPNGGVYLDAASGFARACPESCAAIFESESAPIWVTNCAADSGVQ
jgi:hypothetical protein